MAIAATIVFYGAMIMFIGGMAYRWTKWLTAGVPLNIAAEPSPSSALGSALRVAGELLFFRSLLKGGGRMLWLLAIIFHYSIVFVFLRHSRYFFYHVPSFIASEFIQETGAAAGAVLAVCLFIYLCRRYSNIYLVYSSVFSDYLSLLLMGATAATGLLVSYYFRQDLAEVKFFIRNIVALNPTGETMSVPGPAFMVHFFLACALFAYFPYSKLVHAGAVAVSPTRFMNRGGTKKHGAAYWDSISDDMNSEWTDIQSAGIEYRYNMKDMKSGGDGDE